MNPTPEQIEAAKMFYSAEGFSLSQSKKERWEKVDALASFLASRESEKNALIAELRKESADNRMEFSAAKGAAISNRLRAEQSEAARDQAVHELGECSRRAGELESALKARGDATRQADRITDDDRWNKGMEIIEEISSCAQSTDPKRDWKESQDAICEIYKIAHSIRSPGCRKNHPELVKTIDAAIRASRRGKP